MPLLLTFFGILTLVILVAYFKLDTFISFIIVAIGLGLASGMGVSALGTAIKKGIGDTLGELVLIIGFGAMLGKLVAESGAAQRITDTLLLVFGKKHIRWGLALAGFIIGIPLFYNAGFIVVIPLIYTITAVVKLPMLTVAVPMLAALSVAHGYLPPHPSPAAIAGQLHADLSKTLLYGIIVAIPSIVVAGPIFGKTLTRFQPQIDRSLFNIKPLTNAQMPSLFVSLFTALLPVFLLTFTAIFKDYLPDNQILKLIAEPYIGMLISVLVAIYLLGTKQGESLKDISKKLEDSFKGASVILLIVAGAGALKQVLNDGGVSLYIGQQLLGINISPIVLAWATAGLVRVCVGSATVAGMTTVGILGPMIESQTGIKPEIMVLAIGSGSLMFSHLNDGGFWLFKEYFNLSIKETLQTWTVMETIVSVVGLLSVLLLNMALGG